MLFRHLPYNKQTVQELVHMGSAQGYLRADFRPFAQSEVSDRFLRHATGAASFHSMLGFYFLSFGFQANGRWM